MSFEGFIDGVISRADDPSGLTWGGQSYETADGRVSGKLQTQSIPASAGLDIQAQKLSLYHFRVVWIAIPLNELEKQTIYFTKPHVIILSPSLFSHSMSGQYLNAITENASRLGQRIQESFSEHTRDFGINRGLGTAYLDTIDDGGKALRTQLDSSSDREKLDALKRLVAVRRICVSMQLV